jgi:hypothetical protein
MPALRNILTTIWCAVIIGTNVFGLIIVARTLGYEAFQQSGLSLPVVQMIALAGLGLISLVSTKFLWAILALATISLLLSFGYDVLINRSWRPASMLGGLFLIIPTYFLARWDSLARRSDFNPVQEF